MAINWLTVIQMVPWSDVIANAPKVADAAKKLWGTVSRKDGPATAVPRDIGPVGAPVDNATLRAHITALEAAVADLQEQMRASSELIKTLAEQNAQLVARIEANRRRMIWVAGIAAVALVTTLALALPARAQAQTSTQVAAHSV